MLRASPKGRKRIFRNCAWLPCRLTVDDAAHPQEVQGFAKRIHRSPGVSRSFEKEKPKNVLSAAGSEAIVTAYSEWQREPGFSQVVTSEEVASRDCNLNPARYIRRRSFASLMICPATMLRFSCVLRPARRRAS